MPDAILQDAAPSQTITVERTAETEKPAHNAAADWEDKYKKAQGYNKAVTQERNDWQTKANSAQQEVERLKTESAVQTDALQKELQIAKESAEALRVKVQSHERASTIGALVRKDFSELSDLYDSGLLLGLDSLAEDALKVHL